MINNWDRLLAAETLRQAEELAQAADKLSAYERAERDLLALGTLADANRATQWKFDVADRLAAETLAMSDLRAGALGGAELDRLALETFAEANQATQWKFDVADRLAAETLAMSDLRATEMASGLTAAERTTSGLRASGLLTSTAVSHTYTSDLLREIAARDQAWIDDILKQASTVGTLHDFISASQSAWERTLWTDSTMAAANLAGAGLSPTAMSAFYAPSPDTLSTLASQALNHNAVQAMLSPLSTDAAVLGAFEQLQTPWLHQEHAIASDHAMADLQLMGLSIGNDPFNDATAEAIRGKLGDWRNPLVVDPLWIESPVRLELYSEMGLDRGLADFPAPAFDQGLRLAGLTFAPALIISDEEELDDTEQDLTPDHRRALEAYDLLRRFEVVVRRFLVSALETAHGHSWMDSHLPRDMKDKWEGKRQIVLSKGLPDQPLHEFADFADYLPIIERRQNWSTVFKPVFLRVEDMRESFNRLFPVRIATMHARPVTQDDVLLLRFETTRIIRAIRRSGLAD